MSSKVTHDPRTPKPLDPYKARLMEMIEKLPPLPDHSMLDLAEMFEHPELPDLSTSADEAGG